MSHETLQPIPPTNQIVQQEYPHPPEPIIDAQSPTDTILPDYVPEVSFDIDLGKRYKHVDFDYEAYAAKARRLGLSTEGAREVRINVSAGKAIGTRGTFNIETNTITTKAGRKTNQNLTHELMHAADRENDNLGSTSRRVIGNLASVAISANLPVLYGGQALALLNNPIGEAIADHYITPSMLVLGTAYTWGYHFNPVEVRARRAARTDTPQVITLEKR